MGKKNKKRSEESDDEDDPFAWLSACFGIIMGALMIVLTIVSGQKCKLRDIDDTVWMEPDKRGWIPAWMFCQGVLFIIFSGFYIFGRLIRLKWRPVGKLLTGVCGQLFLFLLWSATVLSNFVGWFWLWVVKKLQTEENSSHPGDPNYCAPEIWYVSQVSINSFWLFTVLSAIILMSRIIVFLLGPQVHLLRHVIIGEKGFNICVV
jgi:hypothetical protein